MSWWGWVITAIWGPSTVLFVAMMGAVGVEKVRDHRGRRQPVLVDRRRPSGAMMRSVVDSSRRR